MPDFSVPGIADFPAETDIRLTNISTGDVVTIRTTAAAFDVRLALKDGAGNQLRWEDRFGGAQETITFTVEAGIQYYVWAGWGGGNVTFESTVQQADQSVNGQIGPDESQAGAILGNTPNATHLRTITDLLNGDVVRITGSAAFDLRLWVTDDLDSQIGSADQYGAGGTETLQFTVVGGRTYTIHVQAIMGGLGAYTLQTQTTRAVQPTTWRGRFSPRRWPRRRFERWHS